MLHHGPARARACSHSWALIRGTGSRRARAGALPPVDYGVQLAHALAQLLVHVAVDLRARLLALQAPPAAPRLSQPPQARARARCSLRAAGGGQYCSGSPGSSAHAVVSHWTPTRSIVASPAPPSVCEMPHTRSRRAAAGSDASTAATCRPLPMHDEQDGHRPLIVRGKPAKRWVCSTTSIPRSCALGGRCRQSRATSASRPAPTLAERKTSTYDRGCRRTVHGAGWLWAHQQTGAAREAARGRTRSSAVKLLGALQSFSQG